MFDLLVRIYLKAMDELKEIIPLAVFNRLLLADLDSLKIILTKSELEIQQLTRLDAEEVKYIVKEAAGVVLKGKFRTADTVLEWKRLTTGCEVIDSIIRNGVPLNGINEVSGPSGVGKTQFCLQLALSVQLPVSLGGLQKGCVYISTEDKFPSKRLNQLSKLFPLRFPQLERIKFEDNIFVEHIPDYEQLRRCLCIRLPKLLTVHPVGLIVIDSIAGVFRSENMGVNYVSRSQEFHNIAAQLNKLADKFEIVIVCVNQVSDNVDTGQAEPSLGLAWSNLVNCRFNISKCYDSVRVFQTIFAPDLPNSSCKFVIQDIGLVGIKT